MVKYLSNIQGSLWALPVLVSTVNTIARDTLRLRIYETVRFLALDHSYFAVDVQWHEPQMLSNCWVQSMLSSRYGFSPNCNGDGTFGPKQCFLQR